METAKFARVLRETAQMLEIDGADDCRFRSYERAAELSDSLPESIENSPPTARNCWRCRALACMADHIQETSRRRLFTARKTSQKYPATLLDL